MRRSELLRKVLANCYCRLETSPIHGIGVFAVRNIPRGTNPFGTLLKYSRPGYVGITDEELDALPLKLSCMIRALFVPTEGKMYLPTSGTNVVYLVAYLNHSINPNLRTNDGFNFSTRKRVQLGEELTVDYRTYGAEGLISAQWCKE